MEFSPDGGEFIIRQQILYFGRCIVPQLLKTCYSHNLQMSLFYLFSFTPMIYHFPIVRQGLIIQGILERQFTHSVIDV